MAIINPENVSSKPRTHRRGRYRTQLERLIAEQGLPPKTYSFFFTSGEDYAQNSKIEDVSGFLVTSKGKHFSFWKENRTTRNASLTIWRQVEPEADWFNCNEYVEALYDAQVPTTLSPTISMDLVAEARRQT